MLRQLVRHAAVVFGLAWLSAPLLQGQTMGQQVSPEPMGSYGSRSRTERTALAAIHWQRPIDGQSNGNGNGGQSSSMPMNVPGTAPMNSGGVGLMGTGVDIPQSSPTTQVSDGDLLDIVIFDTPELSGRFRVNLKGDILLPLAGVLHVAGLTIGEITDAVVNDTRMQRSWSILR